MSVFEHCRVCVESLRKWVVAVVHPSQVWYRQGWAERSLVDQGSA